MAEQKDIQRLIKDVLERDKKIQELEEINRHLNSLILIQKERLENLKKTK